ncbi:response regulator [Geomonas anaerohicana]|uniref:Response regulatory domain-containing protein n=1 Tax=Geomonas anaerohicana TaxID=2798583 RepID=A0ABS0YJQ9_9BACT|nr:response regulator [Geomonas anaerohicana]MBJ6752496.1 hypothetical protein [Geomonas anaerohicana]
MRNDDRLTLLLIENDDISREILHYHIKYKFPAIEVNVSSTSVEALQLLEENDHDIVVCDALLAGDERIRFAWRMGNESEPIVIFITADTDIKLESFPSLIKDVCVHHVAYKPVDLRNLIKNLKAAIERAKVRKTST